MIGLKRKARNLKVGSCNCWNLLKNVTFYSEIKSAFGDIVSSNICSYQGQKSAHKKILKFHDLEHSSPKKNLKLFYTLNKTPLGETGCLSNLYY